MNGTLIAAKLPDFLNGQTKLNGRAHDGRGRFRSNVVWLMPNRVATLTVADIQAMVARANVTRHRHCREPQLNLVSQHAS